MDDRYTLDLLMTGLELEKKLAYALKSTPLSVLSLSMLICIQQYGKVQRQLYAPGTSAAVYEASRTDDGDDNMRWARVSDIIEATGVSETNLSPLIGQLEYSGLIVKKRRNDDRRGILVAVTEYGQTTVERAKGTIEAMIRGWNLSDEDLIEYRDSMRVVARLLLRNGYHKGRPVHDSETR